jgi:hypothetical protein
MPGENDLQMILERLESLEEEHYELKTMITGSSSPETGLAYRLRILEAQMYHDGNTGNPGMVAEMKAIKNQMQDTQEANRSEFRKLRNYLLLTVIGSAISAAPELKTLLYPIIKALLGL